MFQPETHGYFLAHQIYIKLHNININYILIGLDTLFTINIPGAGESIIHKGSLEFTTNGV
jgi:hypothetical protein